jgi:hypothetical protein
MALRNRILTVALSMPGGLVTLDQSINLKVNIHKASLAIQNRATIDIIGLTGSLREELLSQFTAFNQRQVTAGQLEQKWIDVEVKAGWDTPSKYSTGSTIQQPSTVFKGQVVICELTSSPPNIGIRLTCFTRQIDRTANISTTAPDKITFKEYVTWAANELGFGPNLKNVSYDVSDKYSNIIQYNPARSMFVKARLLIDIQNKYRPDVAAFVDDDILIVKDISAILNPSQTANISEFIGVPTWTEWGVSFKTLFDQSIRLAQGVKLNSVMNPGLNKYPYVVLELEYELTSRDNAFYVTANANPSA